LAKLHLEIHSDPAEIGWNDLIASLKNTHILQTSYWAEIKVLTGWRAEYLKWRDDSGKIIAASLVLIKHLPIIAKVFDNCIIYVPKGPVLDWNDRATAKQVLFDLKIYGQNKKAVFLKIDPDLAIGNGLPGVENYESDATGQEIQNILISDGWRFSAEQIQFRNTILLDLTLGEDELLGRMKQKTRYNIALARRKGVNIRIGSQVDFPLLFSLYAQTALRDGFAIRDEGYYQFVWNTLYKEGNAVPLIAEVYGKPVSAIVLFMFAKRAYYFYGMSSGEQREKMPNHLLQWEAIRYTKARGCLVYDFWGAPDSNDETDPLWGVYRFKEGFNGHLFAGFGAWDLILHPLFFKIYSQTIPKILAIMRSLNRKRLMKEVKA
jgi:lipid II:glycine glycyltransferase (peptidoglycan interpeptide bridge formation enzyme)